MKSPTKKSPSKRDFILPLPITASPVKSAQAGKNILQFPKTPSRRDIFDPAGTLLTPRTPSSASQATSEFSTPVRNCPTPETPTSSRRQALYEHVRQRSLTASPTKGGRQSASSNLTKDQMLRLGQESRRRCLLGRLNGVAESVWM
jgi:hypothetical protein